MFRFSDQQDSLINPGGNYCGLRMNILSQYLSVIELSLFSFRTSQLQTEPKARKTIFQSVKKCFLFSCLSVNIDFKNSDPMCPFRHINSVEFVNILLSNSKEKSVCANPVKSYCCNNSTLHSPPC